MRRKRVPSVIKEVANELENTRSLLLTYKEELAKDVSKILECYSGNDANVIVSKFQYYVNSMNNIIDNYNYWAKYLSMMTDYDLDNIKKTITELELSSVTEADNTFDDELYTTTINIGDDVNE